MLQKQPKPLEKPMHFEEVRQFLGCGKRFLYDLLQSSKLTGYKLGRNWIVYPRDLRIYLEKCESNRKRAERAS